MTSHISDGLRASGGPDFTTAGSTAEPGLNGSAPLARVHSFHASMPAAPEVKDVPDSPTTSWSLAASTAELAAGT